MILLNAMLKKIAIIPEHGVVDMPSVVHSIGEN